MSLLATVLSPPPLRSSADWDPFSIILPAIAAIQKTGVDDRRERASGCLPCFFGVSLPGTDPLTGGPLAVPGMGTQLQHRANFGVPPEGDVVMSEEFSDGMFGDGEAFTLRRLHFRIENPVQPIPDTVLTSPRTAIPVFGRGLLEAIDEDTILGFADEDDAGRRWHLRAAQSGLGHGAPANGARTLWLEGQ